MNLQIIKAGLPALFLATLLVVAFNWQFTYVYTFLIEHSKEVKLSTLYTHLFIYSFFVFTLFLFSMNIINLFFKSRFFIPTIVLGMMLFYGSAYEVFFDIIEYFLSYASSSEETMSIVLFIIGTLVYGLYSFGITALNKFVPFWHSLIFLLLAIVYSAWFIERHAYPLNQLDKEIKSLMIDKAL